MNIISFYHRKHDEVILIDAVSFNTMMNFTMLWNSVSILEYSLGPYTLDFIPTVDNHVILT
jgi:hypothetical protein